RGESWLVLPAQNRCNGRSQPTQRNILSVNDVPLTVNFTWFCHVCRSHDISPPIFVFLLQLIVYRVINGKEIPTNSVLDLARNVNLFLQVPHSQLGLNTTLRLAPSSALLGDPWPR